ncbi:MAG: MarR family transcriptional regulator [Clostridia bacterium]|nr:MarR family transcriptional regulator [Clostridia bacterium]
MKDISQLHSLIHLFICTDRMHKSCVDRAISKLGIHRNQHIILMHLAMRDETPSQKELAEHLKVSTAAVAVALQTLENDGYIARSTDEKDGRYKKIYITDKGKETVEISKKIFCEIDSAMCQSLTDEELDNMKTYLEKMRDGLKAFGEGE